MKATLLINMTCPECHSAMRNLSQTQMACDGNARCPLSGRRFLRPMVDLVAAEDDAFELWMKEVSRIGTLLEFKHGPDAESWRQYFMDEYTPCQAWEEELDALQRSA